MKFSRLFQGSTRQLLMVIEDIRSKPRGHYRFRQISV